MSFISRTSRVWVFVGWKTCSKAGEWMQMVYIGGKKLYIGCASQFSYIPGAGMYVL